MSLILRLATSLVLLGGAAVLLVNTRATERLDAHLLGAILLAQPPLVLAQAVLGRRFQLAVGRPEATFRSCLSACLFGQAADLVLPWRLSEFVRVFYLQDRLGVPAKAGLAAAVIERAADLTVFALLIVAAVALALVRNVGWGYAGAAAIIAIVLALFPFSARLLGRTAAWLPIGRVRAFAQGCIAELAARLRDRLFWRLLGPSAVAWLFAVLATWLLLAAAGIAIARAPPSVAPSLALTVFVSSTLGGAAAILPAGLGTYEAGAVIALRAHGVALDQAIAVAVSLHVAQLLTGVLGGACVAAVSPLRLRQLRARVRATRDDPLEDGAA